MLLLRILCVVFYEVWMRLIIEHLRKSIVMKCYLELIEKLTL